MPTSVSCNESPCQYPVTRREKNFSKLGQSGQNGAFDTLSIPCQYPVSQNLAAGLRPIRTLPGHNWTESAPFLRTCAALPTRRPTPPLTSTLTSTLASTLIPARAGDVARDGALYSPVNPDASILATVQSPAGSRAQQRRKQEGIRRLPLPHRCPFFFPLHSCKHSQNARRRSQTLVDTRKHTQTHANARKRS